MLHIFCKYLYIYYVFIYVCVHIYKYIYVYMYMYTHRDFYNIYYLGLFGLSWFIWIFKTPKWVFPNHFVLALILYFKDLKMLRVWKYITAVNIISYGYHWKETI
jgi:hypothetical protein